MRAGASLAGIAGISGLRFRPSLSLGGRYLPENTK